VAMPGRANLILSPEIGDVPDLQEAYVLYSKQLPLSQIWYSKHIVQTAALKAELYTLNL